MELLEACNAFLVARDEIIRHHDKPAKFAVVHNGKAAFFNVDPVAGVGVALNDMLQGTAAPAGAAPAATDAPPAEAKKRGRPAKDAIPGPGSTAASPTTPAPAAAGAAWTADKIRALARSVRDKVGLEKTRETIGGPIDDLTPEQYPAVAAKLQALLDTPKPEEL